MVVTCHMLLTRYDFMPNFWKTAPGAPFLSLTDTFIIVKYTENAPKLLKTGAKPVFREGCLG
jgi:hypothetical protein